MDICKRLNGNHHRMKGTIEVIRMYPKMHWLLQDSMVFLHYVPKMRFKMENGENGDETLVPVNDTVSGKISV